MPPCRSVGSERKDERGWARSLGVSDSYPRGHRAWTSRVLSRTISSESFPLRLLGAEPTSNSPGGTCPWLSPGDPEAHLSHLD